MTTPVKWGMQWDSPSKINKMRIIRHTCLQTLIFLAVLYGVFTAVTLMEMSSKHIRFAISNTFEYFLKNASIVYKCLTKYTVSCSFRKRLRIFRHEIHATSTKAEKR